MDVFWSMWRSRAVPCPWSSGRPATETVLLHHEQFKIPERLARFAVSHGMWGFIKKLSSTVPQYVEARRRRCDPFKEDAGAYGAGFAPNPPHRGGGAAAGSVSGVSEGSKDGGSGARSDAYRPRRRRLPAAAAVVVLGGAIAVAAAVARSNGVNGRLRGTSPAATATTSGSGDEEAEAEESLLGDGGRRRAAASHQRQQQLPRRREWAPAALHE
jgi:hypothetical protein